MKWIISLVQGDHTFEIATDGTRESARAFRTWALTLPEIASAVVRKAAA